MCYSVLIKTNLKELGLKFEARVDEHAFADLQDRAIENPKKYKIISEHPRIYPNYWAPIIVAEGSERVLKPMRYRVRPAGSKEEVPAKFNLFNARQDQLENRQTWRSIFMRNHGVLVFEKFYEWVKDDSSAKPKQISFGPKGLDFMHSPIIFDTWIDPDGKESFSSFAIITTEPNEEILAAGHDRCPLFIREENINTWLNPQDTGRRSIKSVLKQIQPAFYESFNA